MDSIGYIDGTTGGMVLQLLLGGFVGGFVVFKLAFQNLINKILRRNSVDEDEDDLIEEPVTDRAA
jgi:hypothetical protein